MQINDMHGAELAWTAHSEHWLLGILTSFNTGQVCAYVRAEGSMHRLRSNTMGHQL